MVSNKHGNKVTNNITYIGTDDGINFFTQVGKVNNVEMGILSLYSEIEGEHAELWGIVRDDYIQFFNNTYFKKMDLPP